jgi:hypothetical protein
MISMGNQGMPAALMSTLAGYWRACGGIPRADFEHMLIIVSLVQRVEMTIMQIIDMTVMNKR